MDSFLPRSYLFVPGNRPDRFAKACASGADAVIIDLEDSVPPEEKDAARASVDQWLSPDQPVLIRINDANSKWFRDDLVLCGKPGIAGIVLPKAETVESILLLSEHAGASIPILPLIETANGFWKTRELALAYPVLRLIFGSLDFQLDLGMFAEEEELLYFRSQLVLVSSLTNIQSPVDGITTSIDDPEPLHRDTLRAKRLGFGAKLCIHPKQVRLVNELLGTSVEEEAWARRVVEAAAAAKGSAVAVDGKMVDRPVLARAEALLRRRVVDRKPENTAPGDSAT